MDDIGDRQIVEPGATQPLHMLRGEGDRRRAERDASSDDGIPALAEIGGDAFVQQPLHVIRALLGNPNGARALVGRRGGAKGIARLEAKADAHAANILPVIEAIRVEGKTSMNAIAGELNKRGILTLKGGQWWV